MTILLWCIGGRNRRIVTQDVMSFNSLVWHTALALALSTHYGRALVIDRPYIPEDHSFKQELLPGMPPIDYDHILEKDQALRRRRRRR
jgi:hypothetical protein